MNNIKIYTNGDISLNGNGTGWVITQTQDGTVVWRRGDRTIENARKLEMPEQRYALSCKGIRPLSGAANFDDFERDFIEALKKGKGNQNAKKEVVADSHIHIRTTKDVKGKLVAAARNEGVSLSQYILDRLS